LDLQKIFALYSCTTVEDESEFVVIVFGPDLQRHQFPPDGQGGLIRAGGFEAVRYRAGIAFELREFQEQQRQIAPIGAGFGLAAISRSSSIAAIYLFNENVEYPPTGEYNAELVKQLTPQMKAKIMNYGTPIQ